MLQQAWHHVAHGALCFVAVCSTVCCIVCVQAAEFTAAVEVHRRRASFVLVTTRGQARTCMFVMVRLQPTVMVAIFATTLPSAIPLLVSPARVTVCGASSLRACCAAACTSTERANRTT